MTYVMWEPFNHAYGPWYRIKGTKVVVQPDLEPGRWYWSVPAKGRYEARWGHASTLEDAKFEAEQVWLMRT